MEEVEKIVTLLNDRGDEAIVVASDAELVAWAGRGYFSAEARAKMLPKGSKAAEKPSAKDAETAISLPAQPAQAEKPKGRVRTAR